MAIGRSKSRCVVAPISFALFALASGACGPETRFAPDPAAAAPVRRPAASSAALAPAPANVCTDTGAHGKHAGAGIACATCHACPGTLQFASVTYPGGSGTAGGTITRDATGTTCSVGCHSPLGAPPQPVAWNGGPLACTSCHGNVSPPTSGPILSSHLVGSEAPSSTCESCHDQSQHTQGEVRIRNADGAVSSGTCTGCHGGQGQTLGGETPPLLVGWSDAQAGDFHGERPGTCRFDELDRAGQRISLTGGLPCPDGQPDFPGGLRITSRWWYASGTTGPWAWACDVEPVDEYGNPTGPKIRQACPPGTILNSACGNPRFEERCYPTTLVTRGFGGTLLAPYFRGQGPLPCASCHDFHASTNAFLLASQVNGVAVPPGTIDRAGVGAQGLCNACHDGDRHQVCKNCHKEIWTTDGEYSWFEGAPVDPAPDGSACFYCHGHEGLLKMKIATPAYPGYGHPFGMAGRDKSADECSHCHSGWRPPPLEYVAPTISPNPPVASGITATTATVTWQTNEPATSYVEYGTGTANIVAGDAVPVRQHSVTLTGLSPGTTYVWRIRSSDSFRNVSQTALQTFTTPTALAVPWPDLAPMSVGATVGTYTTVANLVWYPVTAPSGTTVEYEVQLATDPSFTYLVNATMVGPGVPGSSVADSGWIAGAPTTHAGKPALSHPATLTNIPQDDCNEIVPNVYYWRVRARALGGVSDWSTTGTFGVFAGDPWC